MARWPTTIWKKSRRWCWTQVPQRVVRISSNSWVHPCWLSTHAYVELALRLFALRCFAFICLLNFVFFLFSFFSSMLPSSMPPHKHFHGYTPTHMHTLSSPPPPPLPIILKHTLSPRRGFQRERRRRVQRLPPSAHGHRVGEAEHGGAVAKLGSGP